MEYVELVKAFVKNHFQDCFVEPIHNRPTLDCLSFKQISGDANLLLVEPFEEEKMKEGVWSCDGDKSPGPDGFSLRFF